MPVTLADIQQALQTGDQANLDWASLFAQAAGSGPDATSAQQWIQLLNSATQGFGSGTDIFTAPGNINVQPPVTPGGGGQQGGPTTTPAGPDFGTTITDFLNQLGNLLGGGGTNTFNAQQNLALEQARLAALPQQQSINNQLYGLSQADIQSRLALQPAQFAQQWQGLIGGTAAQGATVTAGSALSRNLLGQTQAAQTAGLNRQMQSLGLEQQAGNIGFGLQQQGIQTRINELMHAIG